VIIRSPFPPVEIPSATFDTYVMSAAARFSDRVALVDGPSGRSMTFDEFVIGSDRVGAGLVERGLRPGATVAIVLPNMPEYAYAFFGTLRAGGVATTVNPVLTVDEMFTQFSDASAEYLITLSVLLPSAGAAAARAGVKEIFVLGEAGPGDSVRSGPAGTAVTPFSELLEATGPSPDVLRSPDDLAVLPYSSGTSGMPKGVMLTHRQLVAAAAQVPGITDIGEGKLHVAVLPFFHIYGMIYLLPGHLMLGATTVTMPRFDLAQFLQLAQDYRATHLFVVPPIVVALAKHPIVDSYDLSSLTWIGCGAAPLGPDVAQACTERLHVPICQGFGMTETAAVTSLVPADRRDDFRPGGSGILAPNVEARFVDVVTGQDVPTGEEGELLLRAPNIMSGYLNRPEETASTIDAQGWLHTGDLGYAGEDGTLYLTDRVKELIKYKAYQVAPARLEAVLLTHPGVSDAAVIGMPDEQAGEVPAAFVVAAAELDPDELMTWVAGQVAPYEKVRRVVLVDTIPKTASGKILRRVLRQGSA
jgi:acyl-CoA synthetase (AMP-forming)/AMP-acid ligase II